MKKTGTILLSLFAIAGLLMAGAETNTFFTQLLTCTTGVIVFAVSMFSLIALHNEE